jgi:hypothetical protein
MSNFVRDPDVIRVGIRMTAHITGDDIENGRTQPKSRGAKYAMVGELNRRLGGDDHRYLVCGYLLSPPNSFEPRRSGDLTPGEVWALYEWVGFWQETDSTRWEVSDRFKLEYPVVLTEAIRKYHELNSRAKQAPFEHDPTDMVSTGIGQLGGEVNEITDASPEDAPEPEERNILPPGMRPLEDENLFAEL